MGEEIRELLLMEMSELRSDLSELQRLPERWGTIMLPLVAGILAVTVNSMKDLPFVAVFMLATLSLITIIIWRLIGYNAVYRAHLLTQRLYELQNQISKTDERLIEWERWLIPQRSFIRFISQRRLLDIFALAYIAAGVTIVIIKYVSF